MSRTFFLVCALSGWLLSGAGCKPPAQPAADAPAEQDGHADDHGDHADHGDEADGHADHAGHDHGEHGPNEGHLLEFDREGYHAEWLHEDDIGKVTVILLDAAAKEETPIAAASVKIDVTGGNEPKSYELPALDPQGDPPTASRFELIDPTLVVALNLGEGVEAKLTVEIEGQTYTAKIEHHEHDHGHDH